MKTIVNYAQKVKEQHALNKTLAPVETDLTSASKAYAVGQKFIHDGVLYQAKTAIAQGAALVLNTNYEAADDVSSEIEALTKEVAATLNTLGAKNFLETLIGSGTTQGVTYTINADGSITLNGTCTAWTNIKLDYIAGQKNIPSGSYILNGSISGNNKFRLNTYVDGTKMAESENGNEASFTIPSTATEVYTRFEIDSTATFNNETFYPMIRLSSIEDDTYAPYAKTNRELTAENQTLTNEVFTIVNDLTAKNFLNIDLAELKTLNTSGTWADNVYSANGLTFTVNGDKTITVSGTATANTNLSLKNDISISGDYILSGCPVGGSQVDNEGYNIQARVDGSWVSAKDSGNGLPITVNSIIDRTLIHVANGTVMNNHVFKSMIRPASIKNSDYVPYAMTNRELTNRIVVHEDTITFNENGKYIFSGGKEIISARVRSTGNYVVVIGNNGSNSAFILYNHEGTNWTRVTTQPQLTVKWVEVIA